jgi:hypothetical protein
MAQVLHVATRKGLLTFAPGAKGAWKRAGDIAFLGEPVSAVLHDARDGTLYAALDLGHFGVKLHRSDDDGKSWKELTPPQFAEEKDQPPPDPMAGWPPPKKEGPSVALIWTLVPGGADRPGRLWIGTVPGGLFRSDDRGDTWQLVESLWNDPSRPKWMGVVYDQAGMHSVLVDPRNSDRVTVAVSTGGVWRSEDAGKSWTLFGHGMRNEYMPPDKANDPLSQDVHRMAACAAQPETVWVQHHNGIFRSEDGGRNFTEITADAPSRFGFAVAAHPKDPKTAWFVPAVKDQYRVAVNGAMCVTRTTDGGKSFEALRDGLPQENCYDLIYRHGLALDRAAEHLAMGSTTGNLWVGRDDGARWTHVGGHLPPITAVAWGR